MASFKARFSPDPKNNGYLFYPKEYEIGYGCSVTDYEKYTVNFRNFLKLLTRAMWVCFIVAFPIAIGLAIWKDYDFSTLEKIIIIMLPLPFLAWKGLKVYNAPNELMRQILRQGNVIHSK